MSSSRQPSVLYISRIAVEAHDGMKDMVGNPAVAHVLAVGDNADIPGLTSPSFPA
jgi:hypothetical protein